MRRRSVVAGLALGPAMVASAKAMPSPRATALATPVLNSLAIPVTRAENRQYSYTDKVSGYFHGRTHTDDNSDWFNGWNIATKRIFHDYALSVGTVPLVRSRARAVVSPHWLERRYGAVLETLSLIDGMAVLVVELSGVTSAQIGLKLTGGLTDAGTAGPEGVWFAPKEAAGTHLLIAPIVEQAARLDPSLGVVTSKDAQGFYLVHAATQPQVRALLSQIRREAQSLLASRAGRMEALVSGHNALDAGTPDRTKALLWMRLTTDQLVMKQLGTGIYAGLPWFNDYWGRDTFISITGALFVTGQYDVAADVFRSFAALQDVDPTSKTYGRVPNRARPDGIEYNSADGTPRFLITLSDLVARANKSELARELWPVAKRAVEGLLKNDLDASGLVVHDDADTWMDAKEKGVRAWSPRGNRAIDVQALWADALLAFLGLAGSVGVIKPIPAYQPRPLVPVPPTEDELLVERARNAYLKLDNSLNAMFVDHAKGRLADHLRPDGSRDLKLRPNALFALESLKRAGPLGHSRNAFLRQKMKWTRQIWEGLVYPWGVATLDQNDPNFHPYHEHWHYYHKDAAYHNGTVWPWLNGVAMESLLRFNLVDQPWALFETMNRQALTEGAVGSLAECADALPVPGSAWTRRTGTFLQAWSNAEHLRLWHEGFLGVKAYESSGIIDIAPHLPATVLNVKLSMPFRGGVVFGTWHDGSANRWQFRLSGASGAISFTLPDIETDERYAPSVYRNLGPEEVLTIVREGLSLNWTHATAAGQVIERGSTPIWMDVPIVPGSGQEVKPIQELATKLRAIRDEVFAGLDFCKPRLNPNLKSLSVRHDPPLTY